jgi:hypothetical protein
MLPVGVVHYPKLVVVVVVVVEEEVHNMSWPVHEVDNDVVALHHEKIQVDVDIVGIAAAADDDTCPVERGGAHEHRDIDCVVVAASRRMNDAADIVVVAAVAEDVEVSYTNHCRVVTALYSHSPFLDLFHLCCFLCRVYRQSHLIYHRWLARPSAHYSLDEAFDYPASHPSLARHR